MDRSGVINFGAGPAPLPVSVLEEAQGALLNFQGSGIGIAEISHRSKEFTACMKSLEQQIRKQLAVPPTHSILFTQGGGSLQFSAVVLNMLARHRLLHPTLSDQERVVDYVVTGSWSKKAAEEARRIAAGHGTVCTVVDARVYSKDGKSFDNIPPHAEYQFSRAPALVYLTLLLFVLAKAFMKGKPAKGGKGYRSLGDPVPPQHDAKPSGYGEYSTPYADGGH